MSNTTLINELRAVKDGTAEMPVGTPEWCAKMDSLVSQAVERLSAADHVKSITPNYEVIKEAWNTYQRGLAVSDRELATVKMYHDHFAGLFNIFIEAEGWFSSNLAQQGRRIDDLIERRKRK
jgi:hypothetical protein